MPTTSRPKVILSEERHRSPLRRALTRGFLLLFAAGLVVAGVLGARGLMHNFGGP